MDWKQKIWNKYLSIPKPLKASIWFAICSILQKGIALFTVPIFTRMMTTEQYGIYSQYISWYSILLIFTSLSLFNGVFNNAMIKYEKDQDGYISSMQTLVGIITLAFFVVYLLFQNRLNVYLGMPTPMVLLLFVELLFTPAYQFWMVKHRFDFDYKNVVIVTLIKSLLNPAIGVVFVYFSVSKDLARVVSVVVIEVIFCGVICYIQYLKGKTFVSIEYWKYAITFNIPLIPHYLAGSILNQGDRVMIGNMIGKTEVALYSVAGNIGQVLNIFTLAISSTYTPWFYKKLKRNEVEDIESVTSAILLLMAGMITIVVIIGPELLMLLGTEEYQDAKIIIPPIAGSVFFILLYNLLANIEFYYEIRKYVLIGSTVAALTNLGLNYIFINIYGYYAAGYTTLICYIVYGLSHLFFAKRISYKRLNKKDLYNSYTIIILSIYMVVLSIFATCIYELLIVRYMLLLVAVIIAMVNRNKILACLNVIRK